MTDNFTWNNPGLLALAGTPRGIEHLLAYVAPLAKANFKAKPTAFAEQGDCTVDHRGLGSDAAGGLELACCAVFRFEGEEGQGVTNFCSGQHLVAPNF